MFKIGDKVRIKDNLEIDKGYGTSLFVASMEMYKGKEAIITHVWDSYYELNIDGGFWKWTDNMLEKVNEPIFGCLLGSLNSKLCNVEFIYGKEKEKMNFNKIIEIYKNRKENIIIEEYKQKHQELIEKDDIQKIYLETENQINVMLDRDEDDRIELSRLPYYTEKTEQKMEKIKKEREKNRAELLKIIEEAEAQLEAIPEGDYENGISILKTYGILDKEGKINA